LLASFVLLPWLGERWALVTLSAPLAVAGAIAARRPADIAAAARPGLSSRAALLGAGVIAAVLVMSTRDIESVHPDRLVRRDYAATVLATRDADGDMD